MELLELLALAVKNRYIYYLLSFIFIFFVSIYIIMINIVLVIENKLSKI